MSRRSFVTALAVVASLVLAPAAGAQSDSWTQLKTGPQWAKVNICAPGQVGMRASLPGDGGGGSMSARFTLQWLNPQTQAWEVVPGAAVSHWIDAGPAVVLWSQVGYTFQVDPSPAGTTFTYRGVAELQTGAGGTTLTTGNCAL